MLGACHGFAVNAGARHEAGETGADEDVVEMYVMVGVILDGP